MGLHVTVISTSPKKEKEAREHLGADNFIVSRADKQMAVRRDVSQASSVSCQACQCKAKALAGLPSASCFVRVARATPVPVHCISPPACFAKAACFAKVRLRFLCKISLMVLRFLAQTATSCHPDISENISASMSPDDHAHKQMPRRKEG